MKRHSILNLITTMIIPILVLSLYIPDCVAKSPKNNTQNTITIPILKTQLNKILQEPYTVDITDNSIAINFPEVILTADDFLKNKIFSIASLLVSSHLSKDILISTWKDLNSNYIYKSALLKEDLEQYNKANISYNTLFDRIKIAKSQINRDDLSLQTIQKLPEEETKLTLAPLSDTKKEITYEKPELKTKKSMESFYTPVLKPLIHSDFDVQAQDNYVIINIWAKPNEDELALKNSAYNIFRSIMGINPSLGKIIIRWQNEKGDFGKTASLAGIYIKDFFRKKITQKELQQVIQICSIEPKSCKLNKVSEIGKLDVPIENLRKSQNLRKAADIYRQNKNLDSAIRTYKQAIKFNPNDYISYYWLGEIYIEKNNIKLAKEHLNKALGLNTEFRQADKALSKITQK